MTTPRSPIDASRAAAFGLRSPSLRSLPRLLPLARPKSDVAAAVAILFLVLLTGEALGCPTCKDGVAESDPEGMNLARGYFYSILIMLAMPFTLAGSFGAYVWREMRRQEKARLEGRDIREDVSDSSPSV